MNAIENEELRQAAGRIAAWLPEWKVVEGDGPRDGALYLEGPENVLVLVSRPWNEKGRLEFYVSPDNGLHGFEAIRAERPQCKVGMDRDSAAAARDVKRRCLDAALPYVLGLREKKRAHDEQTARRWAELEALAAAFGGEIHKSVHTNYYNESDPTEAKAERGRYDDPEVIAQVKSGRCVTDRQPWTYGPDVAEIRLERVLLDVAEDLLAFVRMRLWPENGEQRRLL